MATVACSDILPIHTTLDHALVSSFVLNQIDLSVLLDCVCLDKPLPRLLLLQNSWSDHILVEGFDTGDFVIHPLRGCNIRSCLVDMELLKIVIHGRAT